MVSPVMDSFSFIPPQHPFYGDVARFKAQFEDAAELRARLEALHKLGEPGVRSVLRGHHHSGSGWEFRGSVASRSRPSKERGSMLSHIPSPSGGPELGRHVFVNTLRCDQLSIHVRQLAPCVAQKSPGGQVEIGIGHMHQQNPARWSEVPGGSRSGQTSSRISTPRLPSSAT